MNKKINKYLHVNAMKNTILTIELRDKIDCKRWYDITIHVYDIFSVQILDRYRTPRLYNFC